MGKIGLIVSREYLIRVRKPSFIVMTILGPILMAAMFIVPVYLAMTDEGSQKTVAVIDDSGLFWGKFKTDESHKFIKLEMDLEEAKSSFEDLDVYALLYIPKKQLNLPNQGMLYSDKQPNLDLKSYIERVMRKEIEEQKLVLEIDKLSLNEKQKEIAFNIPVAIKTNINISTIKLGEGDEETQTYAGLSMAVGGFTAFMIYMFIFIFGAQIMRGVIEEKTNRIIEVIVSSVKPFQILMGKILGIAMVGLTQLLLWVVLTTGIVSLAQSLMGDDIKPPKTEMVSGDQLVPSDNVKELSAPQKVFADDTFHQLCFYYSFVYFLFSGGLSALCCIVFGGWFGR